MDQEEVRASDWNQFWQDRIKGIFWAAEWLMDEVVYQMEKVASETTTTEQKQECMRSAKQTLELVEGMLYELPHYPNLGPMLRQQQLLRKWKELKGD